MNTTKLIAVCIPALFIIMLLPTASALDPSIGAQEYTASEQSVFTDKEVTVLSTDKKMNFEKMLSKSTSKISVEQNFENISTGDIVIIDKSWVSSNEIQNVKTNVKHLLTTGSPVLYVGDSSDLLKDPEINSGSWDFSDDGVMYGLWIDESTGISYSYSVTCKNINDAIAKAYVWADNILTKDSIQKSSNSANGPYWKMVATATKDVECRGTVFTQDVQFGWYTVDTFYETVMDRPVQEISNSKPYYTYYITNYIIHVIPNSSFCTSGVEVYNDIGGSNTQRDQDLVDYGPSTTIGLTEVSYEIGFSIGYDGLQFSGSKSYSYSIADITVHDHSNKVTEVFNISHDVNENTAAGRDTINLKPASLVSVKSTYDNIGGGYYKAVEEYKVTMCKSYGDNIVRHTHYTDFKSLTSKNITNTVKIDINNNGGTDGWNSYSFYEGIGATMGFNMSNFEKNGSTLLGFSTNPNATTPMYALNDTYIIQEPVTFYAVWG